MPISPVSLFISSIVNLWNAFIYIIEIFICVVEILITIVLFTCMVCLFGFCADAQSSNIIEVYQQPRARHIIPGGDDVEAFEYPPQAASLALTHRVQVSPQESDSTFRATAIEKFTTAARNSQGITLSAYEVKVLNEEFVEAFAQNRGTRIEVSSTFGSFAKYLSDGYL
jgi:hypothetical protein